MAEIVIRPFRKIDREQVRGIAWETAFLGEPASAFFADKEILADALTRYFTDYEPESCLVAETGGVVVGYLLGTKNSTILRRIFRTRIAPNLFLKALLRGTFWNRKNAAFIFHSLCGWFRGEFGHPDFLREYPASLHINVREGFRALGAGGMLMDAFVRQLSPLGIPGIHLTTMSVKAGAFFVKQGFVLLFTGRRCYFRYLLHEDIPYFTYGRKLQ